MNRRFFENGQLVSCNVMQQPQWAVGFNDSDPNTPSKSMQTASDLSPEKMIAERHNHVSGAATLESLVKSNRFLALSLPNCPQCDELKQALVGRGVPSDVFVKWDKADPRYPELKAALGKHAGGSFTFPQVFAAGEYQGGFDVVMNKLEAGAFDDIFEDDFGIVATTVSSIVEQHPMVVFSLPNCPQCDELCSYLVQKGLPVEKIFMKWDKGKREYPALKAQLIRLMGKDRFTFPQTFINSEYQGDFDEVIAKADARQYDDIFVEHFGITPSAPIVEVPTAAIAFDDDF